MVSKTLLIVIFCLTQAIAENRDYCTICQCRWNSARKVANCTNRNFQNIIKDTTGELREIDYSMNPLYSLGNHVFRDANLINVHKLFFLNCSLTSLSETAFVSLGLLIELDLSKNSIATLHRDIFRPLLKLRTLTLSYNKIKTLEKGILRNMRYLKLITLDYNQIESFEEDTFQNLTVLESLNIKSNKLKTVTFDIKAQFKKLMSLGLGDNPWLCNCSLQTFKDVAVKNNLITDDTTCAEPPRLRGRSWKNVSIFACSPVIIDPMASTQIEATSYNVTLTCKVRGEPVPDVEWITNGYSVERDPKKKQKYITARNQNGQYTWNNLTITNLSYKDRGEYSCRAKNPGGQDEKNITLIVSSDAMFGGSGSGSFGDSTYLIIGLSVGLVVLLLITLVLVCLFCRKSTGGFSSRRRDLTDSSEECINMKGQLEIKKGLITDVNPVTKPPRASMPGSVVSGGTEVSDVKRNLLDNESVFDCDDESRSLDFDQPLLKKSQMLLHESDIRLNNPYPPDLLPFPPRVAQVSPAGSSTSTVADISRLPPHHGPQSPLHSPIYDQMNLYRTLPYSRSHSPFVAGAPIPRIPRQGAGYVTIPRRPRKSWSSEPPPAGETIVEPLYDNLGLRTTVDGSSALSLNKLGGSDTAASTPRSNRMFPLSPTTIDAIAEMQESSPPPASTQQPTCQSAAPQPQARSQTPLSVAQPSHSPTAMSQTLPRNMNSSKLTPSRTQWAKDNADAFRSPNEKKEPSMTTVGLPTTDSEKPVKIPPRPPPKPKKRLSTGPLFEDEGEDGTEV